MHHILQIDNFLDLYYQKFTSQTDQSNRKKLKEDHSRISSRNSLNLNNQSNTLNRPSDFVESLYDSVFQNFNEVFARNGRNGRNGRNNRDGGYRVRVNHGIQRTLDRVDGISALNNRSEVVGIRSIINNSQNDSIDRNSAIIETNHSTIQSPVVESSSSSTNR